MRERAVNMVEEDKNLEWVCGGPARRLLAMDQFRGYAILGMVFVNYIDRFALTPWMLQHHRVGMSYNDTIAPIFMFVVGMGFRLSMSKRVERDGRSGARRAAAKRYVKLAMLGFVLYWGYFWDALSDIGVAGLLALAFVDGSAWVRVCAACVYLGVFQGVFSLTGYGAAIMSGGLNGGSLGPLSWCFMLLMGTIGYDVLATRDARWVFAGCVGWGVLLSAAGWALRAEWPGVKAYWPFSQYGMTAPYALWATGLCFFHLLFFYVLCDVVRLRLPHLGTLGENPLALYLIHFPLKGVMFLFVPDGSGWFGIVLGFLFVYAGCYVLARYLHGRGIFFKM